MSSTAQQTQAAPSPCAGMCALASISGKDASRSVGWAEQTVKDRLRVLRAARHRMAARPELFSAAIARDLPRSKADTIVTELLPLLDACKFLERNAGKILAPRRLGSAGRPLWLSGVHAEVSREPFGHVLVIGPANFPLFLPGAQVLQALVAGNTVTWKPGEGGFAVAQLVADALRESGLPEGTLQVTSDTIEAAQAALANAPDKVIFTGSAEVGRHLLHNLAETATPAVVELSGADAVIVLPGANLQVTAKAVAFGLRLNGGQVCMSPRRLFAKPSTLDALRPLLADELAKMSPVALTRKSALQLEAVCAQARAAGADVQGIVQPEAQLPIVIDRAKPNMACAQTDVFAPLLSLIALPSLLELPEAYDTCSYALTAAIFCGRGEEGQARAFARMLRAGTVLINDLIAPTADPRVSFGGRGASGYGSTRGAEGLLEMTAVKTVLVRHGGKMRHLDPVTDADAPTLAGMLRVMHGGTWRERWRGVRALAAAGKNSSKQE